MEELTMVEQESEARKVEEHTRIVTLIKRIGRPWVALATGYNDQTITNFVTDKNDVHKRKNSKDKLKNSIIANLAKALKMREQAEKEETKLAWVVLAQSLQEMGIVHSINIEKDEAEA